METIRVYPWGQDDCLTERAVDDTESDGVCPCCDAANTANNDAAGNILFMVIETPDVATMRRFFETADTTRLIRRVERVTDGWPAGFLCVTVTEAQMVAEIRAGLSQDRPS